MGSFVFSNKELLNSEKTKSLLISKGHKEVFEKKGPWGHLLFADKILIGGGNYLEFQTAGDSDFILGVGTFIYKEKYGKESLQLIYDDFTLDMAQKDFPIYGHYAFVIKKGRKIYLFGDNNGSLKLYMAKDKDQLIVSNSEAAGVITNLKQPKVDKAGLSTFLAGKYCSEIPFVEGVQFFDFRKVYIIGTDGAVEAVKKVYPEIPRIESLDEAVKYCINLFENEVKALKAFEKNKFSVELTGGLDSRLISAVINSSGFDYDFVNYSGIFGPDTEIAKTVSSGMKKKLVMIDDPKDFDFKKNVGEFDFGFNFFRHYPSKRWSIPNKIQFSGLHGECLTLPEIYDTEESKKDPTIEKLVTRLVLSDLMPKDCQEQVITELTNILEKFGLPSDKVLSEREQDWFVRLGSELLTHDYMFISACNACMYFYSIYNEWHFSHFVSDIAFSVKECRKLTIALIKALDKEVGSYPFVSRLRTRRNSVNEITELPAYYKSYNWYKEHLPKFFVNYVFGRVGRKFPAEYAKQIDMDVYKDVLNVDTLIKYPNIHYITLQRLFSFEVVRKELGILV